MITKFIHKIKEIAAALFPERCFGCEKPGELLCQKCREGLPNSSVSRLDHISTVFAASRYENSALRAAIKALKYRSARRIADILGEFLARELSVKMPMVLREKPLLAVPIPMAAGRIRKRGYNHAEILARIVADKLSLAFEPRLLKKIKNTYSQAECRSRQERFENIRDSFALNPDFDVRGKTILLIDDVSTTGATLDEAGRVLKKSGARKIYAAVVARG